MSLSGAGLDVPDVSHVVNYSLGLSAPRLESLRSGHFSVQIDGYVHRIGRCGRAGRPGLAVTFLTDGDERHAGALLRLLREAQQGIPPGLPEMARQGHQGAERGGQWPG